MDRIDKLCSYLERCESFADVGCDHGYCTKYMLDSGLCKNAVISDVSARCLEKAERLLQNYIKDGKCVPVCCFGLEKIDESVEEVLIAGMGGEEIISILEQSYIPKKFVLQPMRNVEEVRQFLLNHNATITRDDVFESGGKYYFVLCGVREGAKNNYTPAQLKFGKGDIGGALGGYLAEELAKKREYLKRGLSDISRAKIIEDISCIEGVLSGAIK